MPTRTAALSFGLLLALLLQLSAHSRGPIGTFENSLVLAPLYVEYLTDSIEKFAQEAQELKARIGTAPYIKLGFAVFLGVHFPDVPLDKSVDAGDMSASLSEIDTIVNRARSNGLSVHVSVVSGFFHSSNELRYGAVRQDVRNAQWFSDGWIADPAQLQDPNTIPRTVWVTPSRYAQPLRRHIEEGIRILASRLAARMKQFPNTLLTVSGDGEVELSFERTFNEDGTRAPGRTDLIYADYGPFMVEEFRDWIRRDRYNGDLSPATDDDGDGHTLNGDFGQSFSTWKLRYFDSSGPIPYASYVALPEKLPRSAPYGIPNGFDAPRTEEPGDPFWAAWIEFRKHVIADWTHDFATWMTTSPDPESGFTIPASHFYTHQIPADFIFGKADNDRLRTSASAVETAVVDPVGSTGVTAFNGFNGRVHFKTATPALYAALFMTSDNWGILEYNPSVPYSNAIPPSNDAGYYMTELRELYAFRPHVLVPIMWSDDPLHKAFAIKGSVFEKALKQFVRDVGKTPWSSPRKALRGN